VQLEQKKGQQLKVEQQKKGQQLKVEQQQKKGQQLKVEQQQKMGQQELKVEPLDQQQKMRIKVQAN